MGCPIPDAKRARIQAKFELALESKQTSKDTNVPLRTVQRFNKNIKEFGTPRPPKVVPQGRPRTITPAMEEVSL